MSRFVEVHYHCKSEWAEIILAELAQLGFDYFMDAEVEGAYLAYAEEGNFAPESLPQLSADYPMAGLSYQTKILEKQNWNKEWETHYDPIEVGNDIYIRAHFHPPVEGYRHEIVITPKMSFGTGHHATTWQMLALQLKLDHQGKRVYDLGTGTGILAIMAHKLGAAAITATDIDDWSIDNSKENAQLNGVHHIRFLQGTLAELQIEDTADILLANINLNVLLNEMAGYAELLQPGGHLLLSGFYVEDVPTLLEEAKGLGFVLREQSERNRWAALHLIKA
jgi:ribosomal protein L11 methyltransferase